MGTDSHRGLMGQYAGIVTRGVALIIDILIVVLAVTVTGGLLIVSFVYEWKKMLFFLNQ